MKIMLLIDTFGAGGAERSTLELARYLVKTGENLVAVALKRREIGVEKEFRALNAKVCIGDTSNKRERLAYIKEIIRAERPDIVHSAIFESNVLLRIARLSTPPFVLVQSLVNTPYVPERVIPGKVAKAKFWVAKMIDGLTARLSPIHYHAVSQTVADHYQSLFGYPPERCTVIPRGRVKNELSHIISRDPGLRLVNVGRMEFQKGQDLIVEALRILRDDKSITDIQLDIYGREGTETDKLRAMTAEYGLGEQVRLMGFTDRIMVALSRADVFVLPSYFEGGAGALLEAMASGLPCICSDIDVLKEIMGSPEAALFFPVGNAKGLAKSIEIAYHQPGVREQLSAAAEDRFDAAFELESTLRQMRQLYYTVSDL